MNQKTIEILRNMSARNVDTEWEKEKVKYEVRWSSTPVPDVVERLAALDIIGLRQRELAGLDGHATVFRQWAAHRACESAHGYAACVHAACRLMAAYDQDGTTEAAIFAASVVRRTVKDGVPTPSFAVSGQLARAAAWHGHFRVAEVISDGGYSPEDESWDKVGDKMRSIALRKRY